MDAMRAQLDALMGVNRDGDKDDEVNRKYYDKGVCKYYLCGLCPHDLFTNTKIDMGVCPNVHSSKLQEDYQKDLEANRTGTYDKELTEYLDKLLLECDRKIQRAMRRLEEDDDKARTYPSISSAINTPESAELTQQIKDKQAEAEKAGKSNDEDVLEELHQLEDQRALLQAKSLLATFRDDLEEKKAAEEAGGAPPEAEVAPEAAEAIKAKLAEAEAAGEEGRIDDAQRLMEEAEVMKRTAPRLAPAPPDPRVTDQKLRVCDVCGAFLSIYDSDRRLADHFGGKMHLGYMIIREKVKAIAAAERSRARGGAPAGGEPSRRPREEGERRDRSRERPGAREDRDRDHRSRDRDRDRYSRDSRDQYSRDSRDRDYRRSGSDRDYRRDDDYRRRGGY